MNFQQSEQEVPLQDTEAGFSQLNQENSALSVTLDEVCDQNGKSLGSTIMDEFIASIWNADEIPPLPIYEEVPNNRSIAPDPVISQPVTFSVPPPICKKTVDEVWCQIQKSQPQPIEPLQSNETLQRQPTFGEMTLEDFLVKAGVVRESTLFTTLLPQAHFGNMPNNVPLNTSYILIETAGSNASSSRFEPHQMLPQNNNLVVKDLTATSAAGESSQNSGESSGTGKKRIIEGPSDVVIERRQRRMMKNRESAARSRARRQAYTVELEAELTNLKNENEELKKHLAERELKRREEIYKRKPKTMAEKRAENLKKLKRHQSATW